jgi:hypothetical protein
VTCARVSSRAATRAALCGGREFVKQLQRPRGDGGAGRNAVRGVRGTCHGTEGLSGRLTAPRGLSGRWCGATLRGRGKEQILNDPCGSDSRSTEGSMLCLRAMARHAGWPPPGMRQAGRARAGAGPAMRGRRAQRPQRPQRPQGHARDGERGRTVAAGPDAAGHARKAREAGGHARQAREAGGRMGHAAGHVRW